MSKYIKDALNCVLKFLIFELCLFQKFFKKLVNCSRTLRQALITLSRATGCLVRDHRKFFTPLTSCYFDAPKILLRHGRRPSTWRFGFLAKKFLGYLTFLAKILAINLVKVRKTLQDFSRSWKEIQENAWSSWQQKQE